MIRVLIGVATAASAVIGAPTAHADNRRLNNAIVADVYAIQRQAGCDTNITIDPRLRLAAQWHAQNLIADRALDGDVGSDGSTAQSRAAAAGFTGTVAETVAINPALAINGLDVLHQWYYDPGRFAIMSDCANSLIGVWSENSLDRSVVVAVYGRPA